MTARRFRFFQRRLGQDVRAWPMLALLLLGVLVGVGCVLWFMREAMQNERLAVRQKLAEAWRAHLALVRQQTEEGWQHWRAQLDAAEPDAAHFARCVQEGLADSVLCLEADDRVAYPRAPSPPSPDAARAGDALQGELRTLVKAGDGKAVAQFVLERFAGEEAARAVDSQGRLVAANAELMALEALPGRGDPRFEQIAARLRARVLEYRSPGPPSAQRRFIMRELQRLAPEMPFPTLAAEELAARFLEAHPAPPLGAELLRSTELHDVWSVASPSRRVVALLTISTVRARLGSALRLETLPSGVRVAPLAPGEDALAGETLVVLPLGAGLGGWRLALALDDRALFDAAADQRVARHLLVGTFVMAAMTLLALVVARGLRHQVQLAKLKNDLVANVSHELKTPLTAMRALVDTLLDAERFDEKTTREYLQLLATENARLSRLIDNFLTFSRLERNKFTFQFAPLRPETVAAGAVAAFGERAHAPGCTFESHVAPSLPVIHGDGDALVTAVLNLLDNAGKYSGSQKRIVLRTEAENGSVHFQVQDNGAGLSRRQSRAIFDRFHQADNQLSRVAGGCGLGLSIVRSIVAAHHGRVQVASEPGRGSIFTIVIPAA